MKRDDENARCCWKIISTRSEQLIQMEILSFFNDICIKENLRYFFGGGSLLGAVREKGFISWDDDIDVWMLKNDARKLLEVCEKYSNDSFFFQTRYTDKYSPVPEMIRICVRDSLKWPLEYADAKFNTGIYFDIFPLELADTHEKFERHKFSKRAKLSFLLECKIDPCPLKHHHKVLGKIGAVVSRIIPIKWLHKSIVKTEEKHKRADASRLICYASSYKIEKNIFDAKDFEGIVYLPFENTLVPCPSGWDRLLKVLYGNEYMKPKRMKASVPFAYVSNVFLDRWSSRFEYEEKNGILNLGLSVTKNHGCEQK